MVWYRTAFKNYQTAVGPSATSLPTKATLQQFVVAMRDSGVRPLTCNTNIAAMNAFCMWLHQEGHVAERVQLSKLRLERRIARQKNNTFKSIEDLREARASMSTAIDIPGQEFR